MIGSKLRDHSRESYITSRVTMGYYFLAHDSDDRWYWGRAQGEHPDPLTTEFCGPCLHKGDAIIAGEDWVEATAA